MSAEQASKGTSRGELWCFSKRLTRLHRITRIWLDRCNCRGVRLSDGDEAWVTRERYTPMKTL